METNPSATNPPAAPETPEVLEELREWKVDSTFQRRVNNVCTKLLNRGVRPTVQRVRANMGDPPMRLLRDAMQNWATRVLPTMYSAPRAEWAERPKAISPRIAELFEEMWLQAVSAAQIHHELGEDSSARLTHRETVDMVCDELRRVNTRVSCVANAAQRVDQGVRANNEIVREMRADMQWFQQAFELEIAKIQQLSASVEQMIVQISNDSERQKIELARHLEACCEIERIEQVRQMPTRRAASLIKRREGRRRPKSKA